MLVVCGPRAAAPRVNKVGHPARLLFSKAICCEQRSMAAVSMELMVLMASTVARKLLTVISAAAAAAAAACASWESSWLTRPDPKKNASRPCMSQSTKICPSVTLSLTNPFCPCSGELKGVGCWPPLHCCCWYMGTKIAVLAIQPGRVPRGIPVAAAAAAVARQPLSDAFPMMKARGGPRVVMIHLRAVLGNIRASTTTCVVAMPRVGQIPS
jgi:hypothetical protein